MEAQYKQSSPHLSLLAGGTLLAAVLCQQIFFYGRLAVSRSLLLSLFLIIAVLLRQRDFLVPLALGLQLLGAAYSALLNAAYLARSYYSIPPAPAAGLVLFAVAPLLLLAFPKMRNPKIGWLCAIPALMVLLLLAPLPLFKALAQASIFFLALPRTRERMRRWWAVPALLKALVLCLPMFYRMFTYNDEGNLTLLLYQCLEVYACFLLGAWLGNPDWTLREFFDYLLKLPEEVTLSSLYRRKALQSLPFCLALLLLAVPGGILAQGRNAFLVPLLLIIGPCLVCPLILVLSMVNQGRKVTKKMRHDLNVINAASSSEARAALKKEAGKAARREVIKHAIVGGVIAGDAGAVVGAISAKAKQDAAGGAPASGPSSSKEITKGAVIGGLLGGEAGAIVGATAAKAKQDAENK